MEEISNVVQRVFGNLVFRSWPLRHRILSYEEDKDRIKRFRRIMKKAFLGSVLISLIGGLLLSYWEYKYHCVNSELWMVPVGLILFFTPVIVWSSVAVSDMISTPEVNVSSQPKNAGLRSGERS
ncbi:hypothetical protein AG4045_017743 [Apium graveolens]|uniref:Uncharacterized protein n=1 Tax=Apium graveolens TaxID=4045 RepID=A0A6L5B8U9_APIGR|nr:hypothetical protein AG4045_017743 [Apium graveolens]